MNLFLPPDWPKVTEEEFWQLMGRVNWERDAYGNGEYFNAIGYEEWYPQEYTSGAVRTCSRPRRVGIHIEGGNYYIDPTFFKKVEA